MNASVRDSGALIVDFAGLALVMGMLFMWAAWKESQVRFMRLVGLRRRATVVESEADKAFRQLMGVPEPGEFWD